MCHSKKYADQGFISVSDSLSLITEYDDAIVLEVTGTVAYGTEASLVALNSGKHLVTMNPELQATVGTELKKIADNKKLVITDVIGDQPGSLARLINYAKLMGFKVKVAGNMKRFMNHYATQKEMQPWADDKGLAVRQTTSFTDGTKQAIEMNLVANHFGMDILKPGMKGVQINDIREVIEHYIHEDIPDEGIVDFAIGKSLFPGVFLIGEHTDKHQQKYLRYLGMGEGPWYTLFEPYHLCHLEVPLTIAMVALFNEETINNSLNPVTKTVTIAKSNLKKGQKLDGIGGDLAYGEIRKVADCPECLPIGISQDAILLHDFVKDQPIKYSDVTLPHNAATKLLGIL